jgi:hypothetical protein
VDNSQGIPHHLPFSIKIAISNTAKGSAAIGILIVDNSQGAKRLGNYFRLKLIGLNLPTLQYHRTKPTAENASHQSTRLRRIKSKL